MCAELFLEERKTHEDEGGGRETTSGRYHKQRVVILWPGRFHCVRVWILTGVPRIYKHI